MVDQSLISEQGMNECQANKASGPTCTTMCFGFIVHALARQAESRCIALDHIQHGKLIQNVDGERVN
jgi:hypothetical protein